MLFVQAALGRAPWHASQPLAQPCLAGRQVLRISFCRQGTRWRWMASCSLRLVAIAVFGGLRVCQVCFALCLCAVLGAVFHPSRESTWLLPVVYLQACLRQARSSVRTAAELLRRYLEMRGLVWSRCFLSLGGRRNLCAASGLRGPDGRSRPQAQNPRVLGNLFACTQERFLSALWGCHAKHVADVSKQRVIRQLPWTRGFVFFPPAPRGVEQAVTGSGGLCSFGGTGWG